MEIIGSINYDTYNLILDSLEYQYPTLDSVGLDRIQDDFVVKGELWLPVYDLVHFTEFNTQMFSFCKYMFLPR